MVTVNLPEHDYTLAEMVGSDRWRLVLVADWGKRTLEFQRRLASDNSVTGEEWHGHAQAFSVQPMIVSDAKMLADDLAPLVARVCDGYESLWNGSNHVARFTDDAAEAIEAVGLHLYNLAEYLEYLEELREDG